MIVVAGLGPGDPGALTLSVREALQSATRIFLRTEKHPTVETLRMWRLRWESFDSLYESGARFEEVYEAIVTRLLSEAKDSDILYAVPGHPLVAEDTVKRLLAQSEVPVEVLPGLSALEAVYARLGLDPASGLQIVDGLAIDSTPLAPGAPLLVLQLYSRAIASEIKLGLMRHLPDDHPVTVVRAAGVRAQERVEQMPLYDIDRIDWIDYLTSLYAPPAPPRGLPRLIGIVARLRDPEGGCPWDLKQTPETLRRYILEEAYETVEAIDEGDPAAIEEELGDLLLQVVLQAQIHGEEGLFDLGDVAEAIADKLVRRHPHVFGDARVDNADEVRVNWEDLKAAEKGPQDSNLSGVPSALPSLTQSEKLQKKAAQARFEWTDAAQILDKIEEEIGELRAELPGMDRAGLTHELGDVLTAVVNLARLLDVDPEDALRQANQRFMRRFRAMEQLAGGPDAFRERSLEEMIALWQKAKVQVG